MSPQISFDLTRFFVIYLVRMCTVRISVAFLKRQRMYPYSILGIRQFCRKPRYTRYNNMSQAPRGRSICRCRTASPEPKSADFCQDRPPPGAFPRPSDDVILTSLCHFTYFSVQILSKCVIFALFCHNGAKDRPPRGDLPRPGKSKKAVWGSS